MFRKILSLNVIVCFFLTTLGPVPKAHADSILGLPAAGAMIQLTPGYTPAIVRGIKIYPQNPLQFDFIIDLGNSHLKGGALKDESQRLVKYFLAALTVPEKNLWVNLSPYEKDRIVPQALGSTEMGRDMLSQDYLLKQLTASLLYPEKDLGRKFWDKVYQQAYAQYGKTEIPVNTFNKVWIVPDRAEVYQKGDVACVVDSHLKVMMEEDYLALKKHGVAARNETGSIGANMIRSIILPAIEKEVNEGKTFANLRQIYNSTILAVWFKEALKEGILSKIYADRDAIKGIDLADKQVKEKIYAHYLEAYKKGVYNYIKEEKDYSADAPKMITRKYFSGGLGFNGLKVQTTSTLTQEPWMNNAAMISARVQLDQQGPDKAMMALTEELDLLKEGVEKSNELLYTSEQWKFRQEAEEAIKRIIPESLPDQLDKANDMGVSITAGVFKQLAKTKIKVGKGEEEIEVPLLGTALGESRKKNPNAAVYETIITELLAARGQAIALDYDVINALTGFPIDKFGSDEQKEKLLKPMIEKGDTFLSFAITEPGAGSASLGGMTANAVEISPDPATGKKRFILNGAKQFITIGSKATHVIFFAITDPVAHQKSQTKGVTYFVVPIEALTPEAQEQLAKERADLPNDVDGKKVNKWATRIAHKTLSTHRGSGTAFINADDVILTEDDILGGIKGLNNGAKMYFKILDSGRVSISSISMGGLSSIYADLFPVYQKLVADHNTSEAVLARWEKEIMSLIAHSYGNRVLLLDAAKKKDKREAEELKGVPEDQLTTFNILAAMAKLRAGEDQVAHNTMALYLLGQEAIRPGSRNRNLRDGKLEAIGEGTSEIMRYIITQELIRRAKKISGDQGLSYVDAVRLLLGSGDFIPEDVDRPIADLIHLYEERGPSRLADAERMILERLQSNIADLITDGTRLELVKQEYLQSSEDTVAGKLTGRIITTLNDELQAKSKEYFDSLNQMLNREFTFQQEPKNRRVMVPDVRQLNIPEPELKANEKEDVGSIRSAVEAIMNNYETRSLNSENIVQDTVKKLAEDGYVNLGAYFDDPNVLEYAQSMSLRTIAKSSPSIAMLLLEQQKALVGLGPISFPAVKIEEQIKKGEKKASVILHSVKGDSVTYTRKNGKYTLKGKGSLVIGGKYADVFVVWAVDNKGENPQFFMVEKNPQVSVAEVEGTLGLEDLGFADVKFNDSPAIDRVGPVDSFEGYTFSKVMEMEKRGVQAIAIGVSEGIAQVAEERARVRLQGPPGDQKPNLYHEPVHGMVERIIDRIELIAKLDVTDPQQMRQLIHLMALNGEDGVQILGGQGLDTQERIINGGWLSTATIGALVSSDLQLEESLPSDKAMKTINQSQARKAGNPQDLGGIDLGLNLKIKRDGKGIPLSMNEQSLENIHIQGFSPNIVNIEPIRDFRALLNQ